MITATSSSSGLRTGRPPTAATVAALAVGVGLVATAGDDGVVLCPVRRCTGGHCPGCGGTRAVRQLVGGDVGGAWSHSPWMVLIAVQVVVLVGAAGVASRVGRRPPWRRLVVPFAIANAALAVGIWMARLATGSIPSPF